MLSPSGSSSFWGMLTIMVSRVSGLLATLCIWKQAAKLPKAFWPERGTTYVVTPDGIEGGGCREEWGKCRFDFELSRGLIVAILIVLRSLVVAVQCFSPMPLLVLLPFWFAQIGGGLLGSWLNRCTTRVLQHILKLLLLPGVVSQISIIMIDRMNRAKRQKIRQWRRVCGNSRAD